MESATSTTNFNTNGAGSATGGSGQQKSALKVFMKRALQIVCKQWFYIGIAIFLATLNLVLGILVLSYLHPKKETVLFAIVCLAILLALSHFASLCYLIQRAKDEISDPTYIDGGYSIGIVILFAISGAILTIELPSKCYSGNNEHIKLIGRGTCGAITAMATSAWLAVIIMIVATILIFVAARKAIELAKMPPPVFPEGAQAPVMRWLDRNDPFLTVSERRQQYAV
ncbi:hypothetical protein CVT26_013899 [Gymnopilus dilepis]|uniref:MARVEL domain-containing protein n=1 Tax=Gymnopilus dilepis TaxID=231916 RepID=A0A409WDN8_9AGAR|nr:hypothetical protein CVT26_013899 [Gymnopilus dilepis]